MLNFNISKIDRNIIDNDAQILEQARAEAINFIKYNNIVIDIKLKICYLIIQFT